jgi:hypothetical protein
MAEARLLILHERKGQSQGIEARGLVCQVHCRVGRSNDYIAALRQRTVVDRVGDLLCQIVKFNVWF